MAINLVYHKFSLLVKDMTTQSKLLNDVISTVREITVLAKYSPKCEQLFGSIQSNLECHDDDEGLDQFPSLSELCVTNWKIGQRHT